MHVFWERGYEAASISDLTAAMGITPPSLYTAFGDKEQLFLEAIERYALGYGSISTRALREEPTAREAIERWLHESAAELTEPCHPKGCMVVMAATNCSAAAEPPRPLPPEGRMGGEARDNLPRGRRPRAARARPPARGGDRQRHAPDRRRHRRRRTARRHRRPGSRELLCHCLPGHVAAGEG